MKNTPFTHKHIALGAKMAEFAGYNMPISYTGINDEHAAVRKNAGGRRKVRSGNFESGAPVVNRISVGLIADSYQGGKNGK